MGERRSTTHGSASSPFDAVILDLDGVVTDTASVHARAWKKLFDAALPRLAPAARPFDDADYRSHLDGRTREDGIREFLASRAIDEDAESIAALATEKQRLFEAELATTGVSTVPGTVEFLRAVRGRGIRTALATSSRNAASVAAAAGVTDLFDVCVDGNDLRRLRLAGKPSPALFLEACRALAVEPDRTVVVVEDAVSGRGRERPAASAWWWDSIDPPRTRHFWSPAPTWSCATCANWTSPRWAAMAPRASGC